MSKTILLIEDNKEMRENIAEILELANYTVRVAEDGKEGVIKAKEAQPDLIICDIMMPKMDGYETLYLLGKDEKTSNIPFIFLTAKAEKTDWRKGMNLGADDYLTKPFEEMELLNAVEIRLQRSESLRKTFNGNAESFNQFIDTAKGLEELQSLSLTSKGKVVKKNDVLFQEGNYSGGVFFIGEGRIRTYKINDVGKEYTTGLYAEGDFIGYMALMKEEEYSDTAVAIEDSTVYKIHKDDFTQLLYKNREVAKAFIQMLSGSILEKEQELINLAYNSVRKRVADGLLLLQKKYHSDPQEDFSISIPRDDLASIAGTSTESVIRVLSDLKQENLVKIKGSNVTIIDTQKLADLRQ